jgi:hypothetical protein
VDLNYAITNSPIETLMPMDADHAFLWELTNADGHSNEDVMQWLRNVLATSEETIQDRLRACETFIIMIFENTLTSRRDQARSSYTPDSFSSSTSIDIANHGTFDQALFHIQDSILIQI